MANDIDKTSPHYKGEFGSIYEVNQKFPNGGVAGDYVEIDGWAHYWNADRGTWCVNAQRDSYWDELITGIIEKFKLFKGATYMGVAGLDTVPAKAIGAKMYYFATVAGTYKSFGGLVVPQGINVLYSEDGKSWVCSTLLEVAQELGVSTRNVVSQKVVNDALNLKANQSSVNEALAKKADKETVNTALDKKADKETVNTALDKKFDKENVAQESGESEDKVMSQKSVSDKLDGLAKNLDKTTIKDEEGTVVETPFHYIQNEEFIFAKVDAEDRLLFGIQWDGTPKFGKTSAVEDRLQSQVNLLADKVTAILGDDNTTSAIDTLKELKDFFAGIDNTQTLTSILANLNTTIGKVAIKDESGEIQDTPFRVIKNDEYITAVVDTKDRILAGIKYDAQPYFPNHEMYSVIANEEWLYAIIDAEKKVLAGFRADDGHMIVGGVDISTFIANAIIDVADIKKRIAHLSTIENDEYLSVETDAEGKVIGYVAPDGSHYLYKVKSETIPTEFEHIEDPEGRTEITTDAENRVMSYRDSSGKKHEHDMEVTNLDVSNINLKGNSVNNIQDALKANGFDAKTPIDWSESSFIQIPEPRFAIINITNIDNMPTSKTDNLHAWMEFWDLQGNYFRKRVILNAQGNSSIRFVKKNLAIDICNDEWLGDDTAKVRFGNWVPQDSFHLKAYYTDVIRGVGAVVYKLYEQIVKTRGIQADRPWKKALVDNSRIKTTTQSLGTSFSKDINLMMDTGARCFPDGYPIACYHNDKFYGIFSWQLKKHRDNYHMDKTTATHIHLDGTISADTLFSSVDWWWWEIRNPKGLYLISGEKYGEVGEIAGDNEVTTWINAGKLPDGTSVSSKIKKNLQMTAKVKNYVLKFPTSMSAVKEAASTYESSAKTEQDLKAFKEVYETYFDLENQIDYTIISDIVGNGDGFSKNWQWITYDGVKWFVCLYDCNDCLGGYFLGDRVYMPEIKSHLNTDTSNPNGFVTKYFQKELQERYQTLSDKGIISAENIMQICWDWVLRIGTDYYKEEYNKWKDSPCISNSIINTDYWSAVSDTEGNLLTDSVETFDATKQYQIGDIVSFGISPEMGFYKFKCVNITTPLDKNTPHTISKYSPISEFRHCDSIYRIQKWVNKNIENMDIVYNYQRNNN
jgi:hypothetical protein|nr:MAG TPA: CotH kinase protein [Caudoviricetes sp.]